MNKQYLLIYNYPALFSIFYELKDVLGFEVKNLSENDFKKKNYINDLVISKNNLNIDNQVKIDKFPIEFERLIDILNISFLKKKIEVQKDIKIGRYIFNYNSRRLIKNNKNISLTEKETTIINFLRQSKKPVSVKDLQKKVWGYNANLETHTVETHVYRLRKKIDKNLNDESFIQSSKFGYYINNR